LRFVILLALIFQAAGQGASRTPAMDRKAVEALEQEWLAGTSDRATLERILAPDFAHPVTAGIVLTKQQHIGWAVKHPRPANRKARFEELNVRLYGDAAIANGIVEETDLSGGDAKRTIFTDVFVYRHGRWVAVNAQENAITRGEKP
jgi:Domain of unknown function (DUF4440)